MLISFPPTPIKDPKRHELLFIVSLFKSSALFMRLRWWPRPLHRVRCWWRWSAWRSQMGCADRSDACGSSSGSDPRSWIPHHRGSSWWWYAESGTKQRKCKFSWIKMKQSRKMSPHDWKIQTWGRWIHYTIKIMCDCCTLVGIRTGPFTFRLFSLAPRIRSAQTEAG